MLPVLIFAAALGTVEILDSAAHSTEHFTQGLFFDGKALVETTGLYGHSKIFRYPSPKSSPSDSAQLGAKFFGEGSVQIGQDIFWLTWKEGRAFVLDARTLKIKSSLPLFSEGWGLSFLDGALVMSDGSDQLYFLSPRDFRPFRTLRVLDGETPVSLLNELEVVGKTLYANVWQSDSIAAVDSQTGKVLRWYDLSKVAKEVRKKEPRAEVLNGIAFDGKSFWITGKFWPVMYKVKFGE